MLLMGGAFAIVATPVLNPAAGDSLTVFPLTITCATSGAQIHYTLSGSEPTLYDPVISSGSTITINRNWIVKAKAWLSTDTSTSATGDFRLTGDIAGGPSHSLALKSGGAVFGWGLQTYGRLGNNATAAANILSPAASLYAAGTTITDGRMLAAGGEHSIFLKNGGTPWTLGRNNLGQLGVALTTTQSGIAKQVTKSATVTDYLTGCVAVAAGTNFSVALSSAGEVYTWGDKTAGAVGDGTTTGSRPYAGKVYQGTSGTTALTGVGSIAAGGGSGLAIAPVTGKVWAWGNNANGQLGQGGTTNLSRAVTLKLSAGVDMTDALEVACGETHSAVVRWKTGDATLQGRVFCTGQQQYGRLGNGATGAATGTYAWQVLKSAGVALDGVVSVATGPSHTLALDINGNVWAWGYNLYGAVGDNTTTNRSYATLVKNPAGTGNLSNIIRIAAGGTGLLGHSIAVAADGTVYSWGYNSNGQLGNATTSTAATKLPVVVGTGFNLLPKAPDVTLASEVTQGGNPGAVTFTASPTDPDNNITKVEFYSQGALIGQTTAAPWEFNLNNLAKGDYHNYAVVTDASGYKGYSLPVYFSITWPVPAVGLATSVTAASAPGAATLTATPSDPNNAITKVEFYSQGTLVGQATSSPWTLGLSSLATGSYKVSAKVTNAAGQIGYSAYAYITITATAGDALQDADGDGWTIAQENAAGTSDQNPDTDGDGVPDGIDGTPRLANRVDFTASSLLVTSPLR